MRLGLKFFVSFLWGYVLHQTSPLIDALPDGWGNITRSAVGAFSASAPFVAMADEYNDIPNPYTRELVRYFSAYLPMGFGVVLAYIVDHFFSKLRES